MAGTRSTPSRPAPPPPATSARSSRRRAVDAVLDAPENTQVERKVRTGKETHSQTATASDSDSDNVFQRRSRATRQTEPEPETLSRKAPKTPKMRQLTSTSALASDSPASSPQPFVFRMRSPATSKSHKTQVANGAEKMGVTQQQPRVSLTPASALRPTLNIPEMTPGTPLRYTQQLPLAGPASTPRYGHTTPTFHSPATFALPLASTLPTTPPRRVKKIVIDKSFGVFVLSCVMAALFIHWWVILGGVRGFDTPEMRYAVSLAPSPSESWNPLAHLLPILLSCPKNAICQDREILACEDKFIPSPTAFEKIAASLGLDSDIVPFPFNIPSCVVDLTKQRLEENRRKKVETLLGTAKDLVRSHYGSLQCQGWKGELYIDLNLLESELRARSKKIRDSEWKEYWGVLLDRFSDDVSQVRVLGNRVTTQLSPVKSLKCRAKEGVVGFLISNAFALGTASLLGLICLMIWRRYKQWLEAKSLVDRLIQRVKQDLQRAELFHRTDTFLHPTASRSMTQLRDLLLPNHGADALPDKLRFKIWKMVEMKIAKDSNVRAEIEIVKGHQDDVWRWVGPLDVEYEKQ